MRSSARNHLFSIRLQTPGNLFEFRGEIDRPSVRAAARQLLENRQPQGLRQLPHRNRGTRGCERRECHRRSRAVLVVWRIRRRPPEISPVIRPEKNFVRGCSRQHGASRRAAGHPRRRQMRAESCLTRRRGETCRPAAPRFPRFRLSRNYHVTSFSIGLDAPDIIRKKVLDAAIYPVLKLKVGDPHDRENLAALRSAAPDKPVRVDANEAWKTREEALGHLERLAQDGRIQFVEQPMPRDAATADLIWLKERSPLPLFADEACHNLKDIPRCAECFHGVNVKLVKTGGVSMARATLQAARRAGLKTMIGCMIETSVAISAAAHSGGTRGLSGPGWKFIDHERSLCRRDCGKWNPLVHTNEG